MEVLQLSYNALCLLLELPYFSSGPASSLQRLHVLKALCMVVCDVDRQQLWLARSSCTTFGTRVHELVRGLFRWMWTNWNALSPPELARVIHQARHSTTPNHLRRPCVISICKLPAQWTLFDTCSVVSVRETFIATADKCCLVHRLVSNFQAELSVSSSPISLSCTNEVCVCDSRSLV